MSACSLAAKRENCLHTQMLSNKDVDNFVNFKTENYGHNKIFICTMKLHYNNPLARYRSI